jgi:uncharacterized protein (TIGR03382 family)
MHRLLLALLLVPVPAFAWESDPQDLLFADDTDVFGSVEYDSGNLPAGSPLSVRFFIHSDGGASTEMEATSNLEWPEALTHGLVGVPGSGLFQLVCDLQMQAEVDYDIYGFTGTYPAWSQRLYLHDQKPFDPLLLPGGEATRVEVSDDGDGIDTIHYPISLFTGVELDFTLDAFPRATGSLEGRRVETNGSVMDAEGGTALLEVPSANPGWIDMSSTYVGWLTSTLAVVFQPALSIGTPFGSFEVARFDVPVDLVAVDEEHPFAAVAYQHPLPSIVPPEMDDYDFGHLDDGDLADLHVPAENVGLLDLEGTAHIEGDAAFSVYPEYFYASPGSADGIVVSFAPTTPGEHTALLVLESNDPVRPRLEIPLKGTGDDTDVGVEPSDEVKAHVSTCGCDAASGAGPWPAALAALALIRRRRSR